MRANRIETGIEQVGLRQGMAQIEVYLQGCGIGCNNCTEPDCLDPEMGKDVSEREILKLVEDQGVTLKNIKITGAEPLQQNIMGIIELFGRKGYYVVLETSGVLYDDAMFRNVDFISLSINTPSSGKSDENRYLDKVIGKYDYKTELKAVIKNMKDYDFVVDIYRNLSKVNKKSEIKIVLVPHIKDGSFDKAFAKKLQGKIIKDAIPFRVSIPQNFSLQAAKKAGRPKKEEEDQGDGSEE